LRPDPSSTAFDSWDFGNLLDFDQGKFLVTLVLVSALLIFAPGFLAGRSLWLIFQPLSFKVFSFFQGPALFSRFAQFQGSKCLLSRPQPPILPFWPRFHYLLVILQAKLRSISKKLHQFVDGPTLYFNVGFLALELAHFPIFHRID
jgi:hypothetical protein